MVHLHTGRVGSRSDFQYHVCLSVALVLLGRAQVKERKSRDPASFAPIETSMVHPAANSDGQAQALLGVLIQYAHGLLQQCCLFP